MREILYEPWFWLLVAIAVAAGIAAAVAIRQRIVRHLQAFERKHRTVSGYTSYEHLPADPLRAALEEFRREGRL